MKAPEAYKSLRNMVDVPFDIREEIASNWQLLPILERHITQFARLDVCNVGGITESMKVEAMAEVHYISLMPHNPLGLIFTAATIHLAAASPNFCRMEEVNTPAQKMGTNDPKFYPVPLQSQGPQYAASDTPGLGVEFDEDYALLQEFKPVKIPRLHRREESVANC